MSIQDPGTRRDPWQIAGDHERRIRDLEASCCVDTGGVTTYPASVLANPCLAHVWPGDETAGSALDRVGTWDIAYVVAASGDPYPQYGGAGPFAELPEYTALVNAGDSGVLAADSGRFSSVVGSGVFSGTSAFTIEVWALLTALDVNSGAPTLLDIGPAGATPHISIYVTSAGKLAVTRSTDTVLATPSLTLNAWHYIVARYDGTTLELLDNNVSLGTVASGSVTTGASTSVCWLNTMSGPSWAPWKGRSAWLAFYNCRLTDDELAEHYGLQDQGSTAEAGWVLTANSDGSFSFQPPTVEVWIP